MAEKVDFLIYQGATFSKSLYFNTKDGRPVDLTGYSFRGQLRVDFDDVEPQADFTCTIVDAAAGVLSVSLSDTVTAALEPGILKYDLEMVRPNLTVLRLIQGKATVDPEVTK